MGTRLSAEQETLFATAEQPRHFRCAPSQKSPKKLRFPKVSGENGEFYLYLKAIWKNNVSDDEKLAANEPDKAQKGGMNGDLHNLCDRWGKQIRF